MNNIEKIVNGIRDEFRNRSGFDGEWDSIDTDIQEEILEEWSSIVKSNYYFKANDTVKKIIEDLSDRRGLSGMWDSIDEDIQEEIKIKLKEIIIEVKGEDIDAAEQFLNSCKEQDMQKLQGVISNTANQQPLPERFSVTPHGKNPAVIIEDTQTGNKTEIGLFAYREVRKALNDLFGK